MISTNEHGQQNVWAKEPRMYISDADAAAYALETHQDKAEKANGRWAMIGFIAAVGAYALTGQIIPGLW